MNPPSSPPFLGSSSSPSLSYFQRQVADHLALAGLLQDTLEAPFEEGVALCRTALQHKRKLFFFGNGGSAADAQHLAAEFVVRFEKEREGLPALALTTDTSVLTAAANDYGYTHVFARQIQALGQEGDVALALSVSGTSPNVIAALEAAGQKGLKRIAFTSLRGEATLRPLAEVLWVVPSANTARTQEMHILLGHMLCGALDGA
jgi:D-sedoheptulose 7-phosphate isomerase